MRAISEKIAQGAWRLVPDQMERWLRTNAGNRFLRFLPASAAAVITSQAVLAILTGPVNPAASPLGFWHRWQRLL